jgi:hypothetical protein
MDDELVSMTDSPHPRRWRINRCKKCFGSHHRRCTAFVAIFAKFYLAPIVRREKLAKTGEGTNSMDGNLAQFGRDLQLHLFRLEVSLNNINGLFASGVAASEGEFRNRLNELSTMTRDCSERTGVLRSTLESRLEQDAAITSETVSRWIGRRQSAQLHARADAIEQLATVAVELAALSVLEAERLTMAALLARREAISVQVQHSRRE